MVDSGAVAGAGAGVVLREEARVMRGGGWLVAGGEGWGWLLVEEGAAGSPLVVSGMAIGAAGGAGGGAGVFLREEARVIRGGAGGEVWLVVDSGSSLMVSGMVMAGSGSLRRWERERGR